MKRFLAYLSDLATPHVPPEIEHAFDNTDVINDDAARRSTNPSMGFGSVHDVFADESAGLFARSSA